MFCFVEDLSLCGLFLPPSWERVQARSTQQSRNNDWITLYDKPCSTISLCVFLLSTMAIVILWAMRKLHWPRISALACKEMRPVAVAIVRIKAGEEWREGEKSWMMAARKLAQLDWLLLVPWSKKWLHYSARLSTGLWPAQTGLTH